MTFQLNILTLVGCRNHVLFKCQFCWSQLLYVYFLFVMQHVLGGRRIVIHPQTSSGRGSQGKLLLAKRRNWQLVGRKIIVLPQSPRTSSGSESLKKLRSRTTRNGQPELLLSPLIHLERITVGHHRVNRHFCKAVYLVLNQCFTCLHLDNGEVGMV